MLFSCSVAFGCSGDRGGDATKGRAGTAGSMVEELRIDGLENDLMNPELADAFRDQARPLAHYPAVEGLIVGNDGTTWIERPADGSDRVYFAIAADGEPLGSLDLPRTSFIAAAERARIWVLERNADDVESVVRYRVQW